MNIMDEVGYIRITNTQFKPPTNEPFAGVLFDSNGVSTHPVTRWQFTRVAAIVGAELVPSPSAAEVTGPGSIVEAREKLGMNQREFAGALHRLLEDAVGPITQPRISRWERSKEEIPGRVWEVLPRLIASGG